jgi:uncharacterized membrane protein
MRTSWQPSAAAVARLASVLPLLLVPPAAFAILPLVMPFDAVVKHHVGDLFLYQRTADEMLRGGMPYRDVAIQYPPLSIVAFLAPLLPDLGAGQGFERYAWGFAASMGVLATVCGPILAAVSLAWRPDRSMAGVLGIFALLVLVTLPIAPWRYDLLPAALSLMALGLALVDRPVSAGIVVGLGVAAKLYPAVFAPILALAWLTRGRSGAAVEFVAAASGTVAIIILPFAVVDSASALSFLGFHAQRGLHLESTWAGLIGGLHVLGLAEASVGVDFGSQQLDGPLSVTVLGIQPALLAAALLGVFVAAFLRFHEEDRRTGEVGHETVVAYCVAALLVFMALNKVLSPQHVVWLLPIAPLLRPPHAAAVAGIAALTLLLFPGPFTEPLTRLDPAALVALNVRNAAVVGLAAWLLIAYRPGDAPWARSR